MEPQFATEQIREPLRIVSDLPAMIRFWEAAYVQYRRPLAEGLGFHVPQFPFPLLSPNFVVGNSARFLRANEGLLSHFNQIVPLGHDQRCPPPNGFRLSQQFYLGERRIASQPLPSGFSSHVVTLGKALAGEELWDMLEDGFAKDAPFLRSLLPFLTTLEADFRTAFLREGGKTVGAISVGVAGGAALVLNAVVPGVERGRGLSAILTDLAQSVAVSRGATHAFFWTEHAFFGRHADAIQHYRIFEKKS
ncbi:MAG: hypothetical protein ACXVC0_19420 [Bdellovibrionota bacterium]